MPTILRRRFAQSKLVAHSLPARGKKASICFVLFAYDRSLFFQLAVFFEKFIEHHRAQDLRFLAHP